LKYSTAQKVEVSSTNQNNFFQFPTSKKDDKTRVLPKQDKLHENQANIISGAAPMVYMFQQ
jgi:hypothetical protein